MRKARLGPDHPETLWSMSSLAQSPVALDRSSESLVIIEDCLRRAEGEIGDPRIAPFALHVRLEAVVRL